MAGGTSTAAAVIQYFTGMSYKSASKGISWLELYLDFILSSKVVQMSHVRHRKPTIAEELKEFSRIVRSVMADSFRHPAVELMRPAKQAYARLGSIAVPTVVATVSFLPCWSREILTSAVEVACHSGWAWEGRAGVHVWGP